MKNKTIASIHNLLIVIIALCISTNVAAQSSPFEFTISGHQYGKGKTYKFPAIYEVLVNCHSQLTDKSTTEIDGIAQFPPDDPSEQVTLNIKLFCGVGKTVQSLNPKELHAGVLDLSIMGTDGNSFFANDGSVTILQYGDKNQFVIGKFSAALQTLDKDNNIITGYYIKGKFKVKRIE